MIAIISTCPPRRYKNHRNTIYNFMNEHVEDFETISLWQDNPITPFVQTWALNKGNENPLVAATRRLYSAEFANQWRCVIVFHDGDAYESKAFAELSDLCHAACTRIYLCDVNQ